MITPNTKKWLDALRSGKYEQGFGFLNKDNKYCCLGVLCEVAMENGLPLVKEERITLTYGTADTPADFGVLEYNSKWSMPPVTVIDWTDMLIEGWELTELARRNDNGMSFNEIANYIEKVLG